MVKNKNTSGSGAHKCADASAATELKKQFNQNYVQNRIQIRPETVVKFKFQIKIKNIKI